MNKSLPAQCRENELASAAISHTAELARNHELADLETYPLRNRSESIRRLQHEITLASNAATVARLTEEIDRLASPAAETLASMAEAERNSRGNAFRCGLVRLSETLIVALQQLHGQAVQNEKNFFAAHGCQHEPTAVTRRHLDAIRFLEGQRSQLANPPAGMPMPNSQTSPVLVWARS